MAKYCMNCGAKNDSSAKNCKNCKEAVASWPTRVGQMLSENRPSNPKYHQDYDEGFIRDANDGFFPKISINEDLMPEPFTQEEIDSIKVAGASKSFNLKDEMKAGLKEAEKKLKKTKQTKPRKRKKD